MNIYILEPNSDLPRRDGKANPWEPWYDKCFGMVVVAESEVQARFEASECQCGEGKKAWLESAFSTCKHVGVAIDGIEIGVLIQDVRQA